jgi:hypothetical protein
MNSKWTITIQGSGPHGTGHPLLDADEIARRHTREFATAGHVVESASFRAESGHAVDYETSQRAVRADGKRIVATPGSRSLSESDDPAIIAERKAELERQAEEAKAVDAPESSSVVDVEPAPEVASPPATPAPTPVVETAATTPAGTTPTLAPEATKPAA